MGSLPDSKYIIKTDGYWFVEAHDVDSSKGYISVSAKGIVNGLSNQPNDGCDFGPDSYNPNYSGSGIPYTQTSGIQEAINYAVTNYVSLQPENLQYLIPDVKLFSGNYILQSGVTINPPTVGNYTIGNLTLKGIGSSMDTYLEIRFSDAWVFDIIPDNVINTNIEFSNLQPIIASGYTPYGFINADFSSVNSFTNPFQSYNLDVNGGWSTSSMQLLGIKDLFFYNYQEYSTANPPNITCNGLTSFVGGRLGAGLKVWPQSVLSLINMKIDDNLVLYTPSGQSTNPLSTYIAGCFIKGIELSSDIGSIALYQCNITTDVSGYIFTLSSGNSSASVDRIVIDGGVSQNGNVNLASSGISITYAKISSLVRLTTAIPNVMPTITLSTNPPAAATPYQNTNPYDIYISIPITFPTTASTASSAQLRIGTSSTAGANPILDQFAEPATLATANGRTWTLKGRVPAGWYYEVDVSTASIGTAVVMAA